MSDTTEKTPEDVAEAQTLLDSNDCDHWFVTAQPPSGGDQNGYFRAERVTPNGKREVMHKSAKVLLELCREVDARFASTDNSIIVSSPSGVADTETLKF